ncbi:MAG: hypothetical protein RLZZ592_1340 [Pseudomonadota bacterium]|jgi:anti-anti-sigma factor
MNDLPTTLQIDSTLDEATRTTLLTLRGEIDVTAAAAFEPLHRQPPAGRQVVLDFTSVARINSMGLAQLLRLLESWRGKGLAIEARGLNRTLSMLFKMTGLMRYFAAGEGAAAAPSAPVVPPGGPVVAAGRPAMAARPPGPPQMRRIVRPGAAAGTEAPAPAGSAVSALAGASSQALGAAAAPPPGERLDFIVSQQNSQQLTGWYYLNTLLQRTLGRTVSLRVEDFDGAAAAGAAHAPALVFARPFDACALMQRHGYVPVVRPQDDCDEVSLIVRHEDPRAALADFAGAQVVTALERSFVHVLGRFLCDEYGLDSSSLPRRFAGNEIASLKMLLSGQAELLFMSTRGYERLSALAKAGTRVLERSETLVASHMLLLHPSCQALVTPLRQALLGLGDHDKGRQALQDLGMSAWNVPAPEEVEMLLMLYRRYADGAA